MARNRKRAKERRARRPSPVGSARPERDEPAPSPISHATPDAELAEAQMALGRPELTGETDEEPEDDELEAEANGAADEAAVEGAHLGVAVVEQLPVHPHLHGWAALELSSVAQTSARKSAISLVSRSGHSRSSNGERARTR